MARSNSLSPELLQAALVGLEHQLAEVDQSIADVRRRLRSGGASSAAAGPQVVKRGRRTMSAAAKKRIAEAQRKRWAAFRAQGAKKAVKKGTGRSAAVKKTGAKAPANAQPAAE